MGGLGSGSWWRYNARNTVDSCYALDVNYLNRVSAFSQGRFTRMPLQWTTTYRNGSKQTASITAAWSANNLELGYIHTAHDGDKKDIRYSVNVVQVPCNYGGTRPYFVCPGYNSRTGRACNRHVAKLYLPPSGRYFLCRHCYRLTYRSCNKSGDMHDAAQQRTLKVARKLGIDNPEYGYNIKRPKGMHKATFNRLEQDFYTCREREHEAFHAWAHKMSTRLDRIQGASGRP